MTLSHLASGCTGTAAGTIPNLCVHCRDARASVYDFLRCKGRVWCAPIGIGPPWCVGMWFKRATGFGDLARRGGYVIALARNKVGSAAYLLRDHVMLFPAGGIRRMSPAEGVGRCSGCSWFHPHTLTPSHLPVLTPSLITPHPTPQYPWYMHTLCTSVTSVCVLCTYMYHLH